MAQAQQSRAQAPEPSRSVGPRRARRPHSPRRPDRRPTSLSRRLPAFWKPYRIVIEGLVDAAYVVGLEGRIILGNAALVHLTAYPLVELLGRPCTELYMPEALPILLTRHAVALEDVPLPARLQTEIVSKDGYHIPVELAMTAIFDGDRRVGSMSVLRDLSERYQAEAQVRALIESIPDAMIGVRENGRIALVNTQTEQLFGFPRAELLGRSIATLLQERRRPSQQAHRRHYGPAPRGQAMETELYGVRKDSSAFLVEVSLSPLLTAKGMLTLRMV